MTDDSGGEWEPATAIAAVAYSEEIERSRRDADEPGAGDGDEEAQFTEEPATVTVPAGYHAEFETAVPTRTEPTRPRVTPTPMPAAKPPITGPVQAQPEPIAELPPSLLDDDDSVAETKTGLLASSPMMPARPVSTSPVAYEMPDAHAVALTLPPPVIPLRRSLPFSPLAAALGLAAGLVVGYFLTH